MTKLQGLFATSIRVLLIFLNSLLLICGIVVFISAAILKWTSLFNKFLTIPNADIIINTGSISSVSSSLLVISAFVCLVSIIGIVGAKKMNRFFLIIYEIIIILLFLAHAISILVLVFSSSSIEKKFQHSFNSTINDLINDSLKNTTNFETKCNLTCAVSKIFNCCGYNDSSDFKGTDLAEKCCYQNTNRSAGCGQKVVDDIKNHSVNFLVIPSLIILCIEFFGIIMILILIKQIKKTKYTT